MPEWTKGLDAKERKAQGIFPPDSTIRTKVMKIIAMRMEGMNEEEIANVIGIRASTISTYMWIAGKNGWLSQIADPKDRLNYEVMHKVVRNLDEALDDEGVTASGMPVKATVALKVAEGTLFKQFGEQKGPTQQMNVLSIRIETPAGAPVTVREDAIGGTPSYVEAEVAEGS